MNDSREKKGNILIVDDTVKNIQVLGAMLRKKDYMIYVAQDGIQAIEIAEKVIPDLILLDIMMPKLDGFETCEKLKKAPATRDIPIIFLTAKTDTEDLIKGFQLGAVDYITKPFNSMELMARVETHLELKFSRETILNQSNERKELLHVLCHDLMNPLSGLKSILDLAEDDPIVLQRMESFMAIAVDNCINIIDLVREYRALDEGLLDLKPVAHTLNSLVKESNSILHQKIMDKDLKVNININEEHRVLVEKVSFINSVLNNAFTNAIKFSFPGSTIDVSSERKGDFIALSIKDVGIGIPDHIKINLFNVNVATSRPGTAGEKGTGFGMPLMKRFMSVYGGSIEVFSKEKIDGSEDHGTEIRLLLKTAGGFPSGDSFQDNH
ncbi:hybrid sensor histidine kinase/response regulator [bacterium]|nr:hybrid sensor histidine kinase/response regulator [bacterium]